MSQQLRKTALYCRLSKDDERAGESASIETQKTMLAQYAAEHGFVPYEFYIDDGYTGLNFNRPAFQRMLEDIALGRIGTVITKDLSRLGRDHIKTGEYSEIYFPTHKVRYIAVNDQYDTENQQSTYYGSIKTAINEFYSRDTSVKVKASFRARAKEGKYHATAAPFGYMKDPADHNHLIPDPETAPYVVKIYDLVLRGWGNHRIRDYLRETKVPIPTWFQHVRGITDRSRLFPDEESRYIWRPDTLRLLIRNRVYCGDTVSCKSETIFKTKKHPKTTEDKWIIVENTHEPLVSREVWERANQLVAAKRQDYRETLTGDMNIFSGLLKCGDCHKAMSHRNYGSHSKHKIYVCGTYATYGSFKCSQHKVFESDLTTAITADIRRYAEIAREEPESLIAHIIGCRKEHEQETPDTESETYRKQQRRLAELNKVFDRLYDDHLSGRISDENYDRLSAKYQDEQRELREKMTAAEEAQREVTDRRTMAEKVVDSLAEYADFEYLTKEMLYALVDHIEVFEPVVVDGRLEQQIKVFYRFVGVIEPMDIDATRFYKGGEVTTTTGKRVASEQAKKRMDERIAAVQQEVADHPITEYAQA